MASPFELKLNDFARKAGDRANAAVREAMLEFSARVKVRTPVDTGRLRGAWNFEATTVDASNIGIAIAAAAAFGSDAAPGLPETVIGTKIYLTNPMPYARRIEFGFHGTDSLGRYYNNAPVGMVGLTVLEFRGILDESVRSARG